MKTILFAMRRQCIAALTVCLAACGKNGGTTAPVQYGPIAVRITTAAVSGTFSDRLALTVRNDGGAGQYRVSTWANAVGGSPIVNGVPVPPPPNPTRFCQSDPTLINPGITNVQNFACTTVIHWVVVESQDGSSANWVRTACFQTGTLPCMDPMLPER